MRLQTDHRKWIARQKSSSNHLLVDFSHWNTSQYRNAKTMDSFSCATFFNNVFQQHHRHLWTAPTSVRILCHTSQQQSSSFCCQTISKALRPNFEHFGQKQSIDWLFWTFCFVSMCQMGLQLMHFAVEWRFSRVTSIIERKACMHTCRNFSQHKLLLFPGVGRFLDEPLL